MKLTTIYRAGVRHLRPIADTWTVDTEAPEWRDWIIALALVLGVVVGAWVTGR